MFKRLFIVFTVFIFIFYAGSAYAKVFLYTNSNGVTYLVRDNNYAPNNSNAITVKYNKIMQKHIQSIAPYFSGGLAQIQIDKNYAVYINNKGVAVLSYHGNYYDAPFFCNNGLGIMGHKLINKNGATILHLNSNISPSSCFHNELLVALKNNYPIRDMFGYINTKGKWAIPPVFKDAHKFSEGLSAVQLKNKWGYINKKGVLVIPYKFEDAYWFSDGISMVEINQKYGFINKSGDWVISPKFYSAGNFHDGLSVIAINAKFTKNGYINKKGILVIPAKFNNNANSFHEGLAAVEIKNKWGYINKKGILVIPAKFKYAYSFNNGLAYVEKYNGVWCFINRKGKSVIPIKINEPFKIQY